jgi:hypothetical protein
LLRASIIVEEVATMRARNSVRPFPIILLVALLLLQLPGIAYVGKGAPEAPPLTLLPPTPNVEIAPQDLTLSPAKKSPGRLEDALAQLAAAHAVADRTALDALAANPYVDLAEESVRVILEMAISIEAQTVTGSSQEVIRLSTGQRATIEYAPSVSIHPIVTSMIEGTGAIYETAYANLVQVLAPIDGLAALSDLPGVSYVRLPYPAQQFVLPARGHNAPVAPLVGTRTTEGVALTGADVWQTAGYNGAGVNLAVFDFGFTGWATRQAAGDLPSGGQLVSKDFSASYSFSPDTAGNEHGTACAEIAYDMAPGSTVYLYAFSTDVEFANAVSDYITNAAIIGKKVASMSIGWVNAGPYDGTGSINTIVNNAQTAGILWANSAGNNQTAHWSGTATQYGTSDSVAFGTGNIQGIGPASPSLWNVASGTQLRIFLEWNDWNASRTGNQGHIDYDMYLVRYTGSSWTQVAAAVGNQCSGTIAPTEGITYTVPSGGPYNYGIVIQRYTSGCPNSFGHWLDLYTFNNFYQSGQGMVSSFWYGNTCTSLTIPADGDSAIAVGAAFWNEDGTAPLYGLETFSSCGPRNAAGGAQPVGAVNKPDVVAPDGVSTASYGASTGASYANGGSGFWGTSGAAPHVAGLAATAWSGRPDLTPAQLRSIIQSKAVTKGDGGSCGASGAQNNRYGYGRIALGALPVAGLWDGSGTTNNWSEAANWDDGAVPSDSTPILFNATSIKNATVNGNTTAASLTLDAGYTGAVILGGDLTVSGDVTLNSGTLDVSTNDCPISIGGNFARTSGTFTPRGGTVTFNGAGTQSIIGDTAFNNVVVGSGLTLATSNNVTVGGALTNGGSTHETKAVAGTGTVNFGLAKIGVDVMTAGTLSSLDVIRRDQSFAGAPVPMETGKYWTITPSGDGYGATVTLPHAGLADPSVCRNMGDWWDCGDPGQTSHTETTVTRSGISAFSVWAVGSAVPAPVAPAPVAASLNSPNTRLNWTHLPANAGGYQVWWSADPYFTPGAGPNNASVPAPSTTFSQTETPGVNYYYVVRGVNNVNAPSGNSNRTGKFIFDLTPGSATP